ncbi:Stk1 family PASTA domain-containing Ser/Thr kinase [Streptomyces sp. NBC_01296]|uniref:Stk1 family PASTA domain-containing Ser/Thr kinase n=1 Tax=Streptomyces sp. NBC_01296 TaxID=2903816 RepID=UPI002E100914|nr:Stk1 family PASTA domain-containing Ser/Thr kinase [Streptomyces sp. NBC_01296]
MRDVEETENVHEAGPIHSVGQGRYVLRAPLGEGGMASVHRAHDTVLGRTVAVKTLHADLARDPSFRERFRREARAVAALSHPNIVGVHDSGEDSGPDGPIQYMVMEYVQGRSLRELIRDHAPHSPAGGIPLDRALTVTAAVLDALACSHRQGLVHRDIKPANVMTTTDGTIKVMDFGIARALQSDGTAMTRTGTVLGTPQYLSPEQALGRPADARSDLYSVGCMLFELVTGRTPFDGESTMSVLYQHVQQPAPAPSSFNPSLPAAVDTVVARALSKDPADRYEGAEAMAEDVRRIAAAPSSPATATATATTVDATAPADTTASTHTAPTVTADPGGSHRIGGPTVTANDGAVGADGADGAANSIRWTVHPRSAHDVRTVRRLRILALGALPAVAMVVAASSLGGWFSFGGGHTPDPRATGPYVSCDPGASSNGDFNPPSFTGMSAAEATTCAEIAGLKLDQKSTMGTKYDKDTVTRQEPVTAKSIERGSTVTVWVSTGGDPRAKGDLENCEVEAHHDKISVPWLKERTAADARVCAEIAHLQLREAGTVQDPHIPAGQVAKQDPVSQDVLTGSTVTVWISSGRDPRAVGELAGCDLYTTSEKPQAPMLELLTIQNARACAEIAGLKLEEHTGPDPLWPAGQVVRQEPTSSDRISPGGTVKVWISSGRP